MNWQLDHIGVLVRSLEQVRNRSIELGFEIGSIEEFSREGTRELYVGSADMARRLLLIEAIGDGPYSRALSRRGPGLHHVAVAVRSLEDYLLNLAGSRWYLHPRTVATVPAARTGWLARPGVPCLVEVLGRAAASPSERGEVISRIEVPNPTSRTDLLEALGAHAVVTSPDAEVWVTVGSRRLSLSAKKNRPWYPHQPRNKR